MRVRIRVRIKNPRPRLDLLTGALGTDAKSVQFQRKKQLNLQQQKQLGRHKQRWKRLMPAKTTIGRQKKNWTVLLAVKILTITRNTWRKK